MQGLNYGNRVIKEVPKEFETLSLDALKEVGVAEEIEAFCEKHQEHYTAKPFVKIIFGNSILYTECQKCREDREKAKELEERERLEARRKKELALREEILSSRGCGKKYLKARREKSIKSDTELMKKGLVDFLKIDCDNFEKKEKLVVLGGCGIGKTFFGNLMVELAYELNLKYLCYTAFELASIYKSTNINGFNRTNSFENLQELLEDADGLIIDEFDYFMRGSKDVRDEEALHHIAQICEKEDIRTIILGNCNRKELKEMMPQKVYSRFAGGSVIGGWNMKDLRRENVGQKNNKKD